MATTCKLIAKNVLGSNTASVSFSSIPGTYSDLLVIVSARAVNSGTAHYVNTTLNSSNISVRYLYGNGTTAASNSTGSLDFEIPGSSSTASTFASTEIYIPNYAGSTNKSVSVTNVNERNTTAAMIELFAGLWSSTSAITSVAFSINAGSNFLSGSSFYLYAISRA